MAHYFVWYRLRETPVGDPGGNTNSFRIAIEAVLADVRGRTGVAGRLLVRTALDGTLARRDEADTWMEVYDDVADPVAFERELAAALRRHDIARFVPEGDRHIEAFVALN
ncbi:MAG TPA: DUF4936 family protein [Casimicrobiaceae bacterium]|nr:DUF4936 family protein [Casimicrobiaceae bacterium]